MNTIQNLPLVITVIQIFGSAITAFTLGILLTPIFTHFLYQNNIGKNIREEAWDNSEAKIYAKLHGHKKGTPTMAGLLFWGITAGMTILTNFTRTETFLPLFFLVSAGLLGAVDDIANIRGLGKIKGLGVKIKFFLQLFIASFGAYWFTFKLNWTSFHIPGAGLFGLNSTFEVGYWYIPLFILIVIFIMNAVDITDGLDGLLAGSIIPPLATFAVLAFVQNNFSLSMFLSTLIGALLAFLWFNIHPARFFMGGTGAFALGSVLAVSAFLTDSIMVFPIIAFLFIVEGLSSLIQVFSKRYFGKKVFLSAPIHHHFQALGWEEPKVVMRFWIISIVMSIIGLIVGLIGMG